MRVLCNDAAQHGGSEMTDWWAGASRAIGRHLRREVHQCRSELARLSAAERKPMSIMSAVAWSTSLVVLGNAVVIAGRRWGHSDLITLAAIPTMGLAGASLLRRRGWSWRDLGVRPLAPDPPARLPNGLLFAMFAVGLVFALVGVLSFTAGTALSVVRVLIGTAGGEELVHRGVVLGAWASTPVRGRWIVAANMVTFGMWHIASATPCTGFRWWEVAIPTAGAAIFLWARLRFRSLLAPIALHAGGNMPGAVLEGPLSCAVAG